MRFSLKRTADIGASRKQTHCLSRLAPRIGSTPAVAAAFFSDLFSGGNHMQSSRRFLAFDFKTRIAQPIRNPIS